MNIISRRTLVAVGVAITFSGAFAQDSAGARELLEKAPCLIIGLDNSGSSPATSSTVVQSTWPSIERAIRSMPLAAKIVVFSIGDASSAYVSATWRIQKKVTDKGGTADYVVSKVKELVTTFPDQVRKGVVAEHGRSELIGGFYDMSKLLNGKSDSNAIILISDLIENSNLASCYVDPKCKLPAPTFNLKGASVDVFGVGMGFPSERQMAVTNSWAEFLKKAGANTSIDKLKRVI